MWCPSSREPLAILLLMALVIPTLAAMPVDVDGRSPDPSGTGSRQMTYPDLRVSDITWSMPGPQDGLRMEVFATVRNDGASTYESFSVVIEVDGTPMESRMVDFMPSMNTSVVSAGWTASSGPHRFKVSVDARDDVRESDESNNHLVKELDVGYPDIVLEDVSYTPGVFSTGDTITVTSIVKNTGSSTIRGFDTRTVIDGASVGNVRTNGLASGDSVAIVATIPVSSGTHRIGVMVDPGNVLSEVTRSNNVQYLDLTSGMPDLIIDNITFDPKPDNAADGDPMHARITVRNAGDDLHRPFDIRMVVDQGVPKLQEVPLLDANRTHVCDFEWIAVPGPHSFKFIVDGGNVVDESDEAWNVHAEDIFIGYPDISVKGMTHTPLYPKEGDTVRLKVTLENEGYGTSVHFDIRAFVNGDTVSTQKIAGMFGGENRTIDLKFTMPAGGVLVGVGADRDDVIRESDENDNWASVHMSSPLPNLEVTGISMGTIGSDGEEMTINAFIMNAGVGNSSRKVSADVFIDGKVQCHTTRDGMPTTFLWNVSCQWTAEAGRHLVQVVVDGDTTVLESDETDNTMETVLDIDVPELVVTELSWTPSDPVPGQTTVLRGVLQNLGGKSYRDLKARFMVDGLVIGTLDVNTLELSVPRVVTMGWTAIDGNHTISLEVDTGDVVAEGDEIDNVLSMFFPDGTPTQASTGPDLTITDIRLMSEAPTDGIRTTIIATVGSIGASPGPDGHSTSVRFFTGGGQIGTARLVLSGGQAVATATWEAYPGDHSIWAVVDPTRAIPESNETNNIDTMHVNVTAPSFGLTDLKLVSEGFDDGNTVTIFASIENLGPGNTTRPIYVRFFVDGRPVGSQKLDGFRTLGTATVSQTWTAEPGRHDIGVAVDMDGSVPEVTRSDNFISGNISVEIPDLQIESMTVPSSSRDGSRNIVRAIIKNDGAGTTVREFTVRLEIDGTVQDHVILQGLPSGGKKVVELGASPGPGNHRVVLHLDPLRGVREADEANNLISLSALDVTPADLTIDMVWTESVDDDRSVAFAIVRNEGGDLMRGSSVAFHIDGERKGVVTFDALPSGETTVVSREWTPGPGAHVVWAVADPFRNVLEDDETNNMATTTIPARARADLVATDLYIDGGFVDGAELTFFGQVRNLGGNTSRGFAAGLYIDGKLVQSRSVDGLPATASVTLAFKWSGVPGSHTARFVADVNDDIEEIDDVHNTQETTFTVRAADLVISEITAYEPSTPGGNIVVYAKVTNEGADLHRNFKVTFSDDFQVRSTTSVNSVPGSNSVLVKGTLPQGTEIAYIEVDSERSIPESDETDNLYTGYIDPRPRPGPDDGLDLTISDIIWSPKFPFEGQKVMFFAVIENVGSGAVLDDFKVTFHDGPVKKGETVVHGVPWGSYTMVSAIWQVSGGTDRVIARVDVGNLINEMDEKNNQKEVDPEVPMPDIIIDEVIYHGGLSGQDSRVTVHLRNNGAGLSSSEFLTSAWLEGEPLSAKTVSGIVPDADTWLNFNVPGDLAWGTKELLIHADSEDAMIEEGEANTHLEEVSTPYPNLVLDRIWWLDENGVKDIEFFVRIMNTGDQGHIGLFKTDLLINGKKVADFEGHDMPAHSSRLFSFSLDRSGLEPGFMLESVGAMVDIGDAVMESRENDNVRQIAANGTDLYEPGLEDITVLSLEVEQISIEGDGNSVFEAIVRGRATGQNVSYVSVRMLVDGLVADKKDIESITASDNGTVKLRWTGSQEAHTFKVVIDHDREYDEWDETNNRLRMGVAGNRVPIAIPGRNLTIRLGDTATLEGRGADMDGFIVLYEWDLDGDGDWDWSSNSTGDVEHKYKSVGTYHARFRVTDDRGATDIEIVTVKVVKRKDFRPITEDETRIALAVLTMALLIAVVIYFVKGEEMYREHKHRKELEKEQRATEKDGAEDDEKDAHGIEKEEEDEQGADEGPKKRSGLGRIFKRK